MMNNNWQRLNIWLELNNRFDYVEYSSACRAKGCEPQPLLEFAQKAGMVASGMASNPTLTPQDAYVQFIQATTSDPIRTYAKQGEVFVGCCGGGKVL